MIYYKRDENNHLIGFRHNYKHYYYIKNAQEDIIGIMDSNYNVIANYKYDAYGNINLITDNKGLEITDLSHVAYINPFRYRSYYYDEDTKLYYLNSRYYNPLFGRFINADGTIAANDDIISHNLFGYVSNNPVNKIDVNGNYADALPLLGAYLGEAAGASASTGTAVGWLVAGGLAIASLLCYGIYELTKPKTQTKVLPEVRPIIPNNDEYVYRPAYVDKSTGVLVTTGPAMNFRNAKATLELDRGLNAIVNNQKIMGIYTSSQEHAKALALATGANKNALSEVHNNGYYGHYYDKFHRVHIWYGDPVRWDE